MHPFSPLLSAGGWLSAGLHGCTLLPNPAKHRHPLWWFLLECAFSWRRFQLVVLYITFNRWIPGWFLACEIICRPCWHAFARLFHRIWKWPGIFQLGHQHHLRNAPRTTSSYSEDSHRSHPKNPPFPSASWVPTRQSVPISMSLKMQTRKHHSNLLVTFCTILPAFRDHWWFMCTSFFRVIYPSVRCMHKISNTNTCTTICIRYLWLVVEGSWKTFLCKKINTENVSSIPPFRYGKCGNSASAAEFRFRIPPVFLSKFRFRRSSSFRIPPSKIGLIPHSACQKGPIPPFRNPGKPPPP